MKKKSLLLITTQQMEQGNIKRYQRDNTIIIFQKKT